MSVNLETVPINFQTYKSYNFSQQVTNEIMDQVLAGTDSCILEMKDDIEKLWVTCSTQRMRRSMATDIPGYTLGGDNVGRNAFTIIVLLKS